MTIYRFAESQLIVHKEAVDCDDASVDFYDDGSHG